MKKRFLIEVTKHIVVEVETENEVVKSWEADSEYEEAYEELVREAEKVGFCELIEPVKSEGLIVVKEFEDIEIEVTEVEKGDYYFTV